MVSLTHAPSTPCPESLESPPAVLGLGLFRSSVRFSSLFMVGHQGSETSARSGRQIIVFLRRSDQGAVLPMSEGDLQREKFYELCYYTLGHPDPSFVHQHVVDAFAAQHADESTKPITLAFALIGLYLYVEKGYSGRQVQRVHMLLARRRKHWPMFSLPDRRGAVTVDDVMNLPPGPARDRMIRAWCASVWDAYRESHGRVAELVESALE